ncbi:hypothetical protein BDY21DRAFT_59144 [Lineolata rhizophorae]|uniref:Uncharacterized protein n=1 Tax=Lineolata rhizophorae TaxID=578093 RepID=A0A6A6NXQ2_9PEZI|nr:hypothetical protein BDY21DRAFT_59144 [Lineolata rhizophorae]
MAKLSSWREVGKDEAIPQIRKEQTISTACFGAQRRQCTHRSWCGLSNPEGPGKHGLLLARGSDRSVSFGPRLQTSIRLSMMGSDHRRIWLHLKTQNNSTWTTGRPRNGSRYWLTASSVSPALHPHHGGRSGAAAERCASTPQNRRALASHGAAVRAGREPLRSRDTLGEARLTPTSLSRGADLVRWK